MRYVSQQFDVAANRWSDMQNVPAQASCALGSEGVVYRVGLAVACLLLWLWCWVRRLDLSDLEDVDL